MWFYVSEWLAFKSVFFEYPGQDGVPTTLTWLVPRETAAVSARSVYTIQPCTMSLHAKPHTKGACVFSCNLPFWRNDWDLFRATANTEIRVSTESWPCRRKWFRRSCRDLNPWPFNHESGALTTELSPLHRLVRRSLRICSRKMKEATYKVLLRPLLEYAAPPLRKPRGVQAGSRANKPTSSVTATLEELRDWPSLQSRKKKAWLTTLYTLKNVLLNIDSKHAPTSGNQKKSRRQTNLCSRLFQRTQYQQQTFPRTVPEWNNVLLLFAFGLPAVFTVGLLRS